MSKTDRRQVECDNWHGLYRQGWGKNRLRPASFAHPAKAAYGLTVRIYEHTLEEGWVKPGDYLIDIFAGIGGFALEAMRHGLHFVGCELEQRFVDMGQGCDCTGINKADWVRFQGRWDRVRYKGGRYWCPQCLMKAGTVTNERKFKPLPLPGTRWGAIAIAIARARQAMLFDAAPSASYVRNSGKIPYTDAHHYRGNIETWEAQGMPGTAVIVQGDSRRLGEVLERAQICLSSPPYGGNVKSDRTHERRDERRLGIGFTGRWRGCFRGSETYGQTAGNLGNLPDTGFEAALEASVHTATPETPQSAGESPQATLRANLNVPSEAQEGAEQPVLALSSPPYAGTLQVGKSGIDWSKRADASKRSNPTGDGSVRRGENLAAGYGSEPGQLAQMPEGDLVAVISSPPFQGSLSRDNVTEGRVALAREKGISVHLVSPVDMEKIGKRTQNYDTADGQLAALPEGSHAAACERPTCAISSPPFGAAETRNRTPFQGGDVSDMMGRAYTQDKQGTSPGQLAQMPTGDHAQALKAGAVTGRAQCIDKDEIGVGEDKLNKNTATIIIWERRMMNKTGLCGAALCECLAQTAGEEGKDTPSDSALALAETWEKSPQLLYDAIVESGRWCMSPTVGCLSHCKIWTEQHWHKQDKIERPQACISSPPWEGNLAQDGRGADGLKIVKQIEKKYNRRYTERSFPTSTYGETAGQLGQETGSTFWAASRLILEEVYKVLAPGGHAIWVLKMFVRSGRLVDFPGQWEALCQSVGFRTVCKHRAWMNKNTGIMQSTLDGDEVSMAKWYKSFFRILCESKGSPRIDWELILCMVKE